MNKFSGIIIPSKSTEKPALENSKQCDDISEINKVIIEVFKKTDFLDSDSLDFEKNLASDVISAVKQMTCLDKDSEEPMNIIMNDGEKTKKLEEEIKRIFTHYSNGQIHTKINYLNDKKHGLREAWFKNGNKNLRYNYRNGKFHGLCETWWRDHGGYIFRENFKDGKKDGICEYYNKDGTFRTENYKEGVLQLDSPKEETEEQIVYYSGGQIHIKINYLNNKYHGLREAWYSNGDRDIRYNYKNGKKHGLCESWCVDGIPRSIERFKDGELDGLCKYYYPDGSLSRTENYKDGVLQVEAR